MEIPVTEQPLEINDDEQDDPNESSVIRKLRAEAKAGREAQTRATAAEAETRAAQRELAMRRAGVDVESPLGAMFNKAWDGEIDVDMMKNSWAEVSGNAPGKSPAEQAALERISAASGGAPPGGGAPVDFEAELDAIPLLSGDGNYNPDYVSQVLAKTAEQAAREGRQFNVLGNKASQWSRGGGPSTPNVKPL